MAVCAHRGEILHLTGNPSVDGPDAIAHFEDGVLLIEDGVVQRCGPAVDMLGSLPADCDIEQHDHGLIVPGLIDTHVHFPQVEVMAAYGTQLLDWLVTHTFPAERKFSDPVYAADVATFFLDQMLNNGTTTALVFGTVHPASVNAFFEAAAARRLRMICGKVMMDRNAPDYLCDTPDQSYHESKALIHRWHNHQRLGYAVTPRFAPTSSDAQLDKARQLLQEFPDLHLHTHLAENQQECKWVSELFPHSTSYLNVYDQHQLLGRRSVFAHSLHLGQNDWSRLQQSNSGIAHCPLSNLFIGSGLFDYQSALQHQINVGLGTDIGGGDSFSILRTINEAYKVQQLNGFNLSPFECLYLATLGGARTLDLDQHIGNFAPGKEADFIVLDYKATALIDFRIKTCSTLQERLFVLQMLGDDRVVRQTRILGELI